MIFILGGIFILLIIYYFFFNTRKEGLENSKNFIQSKNFIHSENFIPSDGFNGSREGYVFKNCSEGLGYYKDTFYSNY